MKTRRGLFTNSIKGIEISIKIGEIEVPRSILKQLFGLIPENDPDLRPDINDPDFHLGKQLINEEDFILFGSYIANMEEKERMSKTTKDHFFEWKLAKSIRDVNFESGATEKKKSLTNLIVDMFSNSNLMREEIHLKKLGYSEIDAKETLKFIESNSYLNLKATFSGTAKNRLLIYKVEQP